MANKKASVDTVRTGIEEITTQGDLLYRGASDLERLPKCTSGQTLTMGSSNEPEWVTVADELPTAGSSGNVLTSTGSAWASTAPASSGFTVLGAKIATTSGANVDVTGIPAGVTMVVIGFMGVSLASAGVSLNVQLGTASGLVGSGYMSGTARTRASNHPESWDSTSAFLVAGHSSSNSFTWNGSMILTKMDTTGTDGWVSSHSMYMHTSEETYGGGSIADLGGTLTQLRLRGGGIAFDSGHVNFTYL